MYYSGGDDKANTGNGWTMSDSVTFSASECKWHRLTLSIELDGDAASVKLTQVQPLQYFLNVVDSHQLH